MKHFEETLLNFRMTKLAFQMLSNEIGPFVGPVMDSWSCWNVNSYEKPFLRRLFWQHTCSANKKPWTFSSIPAFNINVSGSRDYCCSLSVWLCLCFGSAQSSESLSPTNKPQDTNNKTSNAAERLVFLPQGCQELKAALSTRRFTKPNNTTSQTGGCQVFLKAPWFLTRYTTEECVHPQ